MDLDSISKNIYENLSLTMNKEKNLENLKKFYKILQNYKELYDQKAKGLQKIETDQSILFLDSESKVSLANNFILNNKNQCKYINTNHKS